jgi:hypothetical protein
MTHVTSDNRQENLTARQHDEQVVVTLPEEIDITNSARLRETLLAIISFDHSGIDTVISIYPDLATALSGKVGPGAGNA